MDGWVFVGLLVLGSIGLGVIGFILALLARRDVRGLRAEIAALRAQLAQQPQATATVQPLAQEAEPSLASEPSTESAKDQAEVAPTPAPTDAEAEAGAKTEATGATPPPLPPQLPPELPDQQAAAAATKPSGLDTESTIGGKLTIWVGGLALALGGLFLVRYAIENALLGPGARVMLGLAFGAALVGVGEWARRRQSPVQVPGLERANVPAMLTAVGSFSMFAAVYAAHALFGLIGPVMAFMALAGLAVGTMVAALLHGPTLAAIGLVAAYGAPFLIDADTESITVLAIYTLAVSAAAMGVARIRHWLWLAQLAIAALVGFGFLFALFGGEGQPLIVDLYLLCAFALGLVTFVISFGPDEPAADGTKPVPVDRIATLALSALALPVLAHLQFASSGAQEVIELAILIALPFAIAARYPRLRFVVVVPAIIAAARYLTLGVPGTEVPLERLQRPDLFAAELIASLRLFTATGFAAAAATLAAGTAIALRSSARAPVLSAATGLALAFLMIAYARIEQFEPSAQFALFGLVLALVLLALAFFLDGRLPANAAGRDGAVAAPLVGVLVALAFAAAAFLEGPALTIALGLIPLAAALVTQRFDLTALRVTAIAAIAPYGAALAANPFIDPEQLETAPVVINALLWGYGIPSAGLIAAAVLLTRARRNLWAEIMQALAILFSIITVTVLTLHGIDKSLIITSDEDQFAATAALVLIGGGFSLALTRISQRADLKRVRQIADFVSLIGLLIGAVALLVGVEAIAFTDPVFALKVGDGLIFNLIGFAYGLPFLVYALIAWQGWATKMRILMLAVVGFVALTGFVWVNLTIRQAFSPGILTAEPISQTELIIYSVVWLIIGLAVLGAGIVLRHRALRAASGAILVAVVVKVFLVDMSGLEGILRALSFIGLGLVLLGIGAAYQRALRKQVPNAQAADPSGQPPLQPPPPPTTT
ncbi:MAG: DUF2339 domain-containing protein [Devosiaceae bacterium]|nr:DUF2339 domain-containing protein [Devosiaceae bacterium MH13]